MTTYNYGAMDGTIRKCVVLRRYRNGKPVKAGGEWFTVRDCETGEVFDLTHMELRGRGEVHPGRPTGIRAT